ncbi:tRNA (adenosine(37)-N6)-threonylcarbamoyltransferase complex transferase subunit TsaD [Candidatus Babeliales bacterium]|nr:tRNA (adenosine(37)-N6)-threonylcarbamoyltransferase complex transferase subunit TsaD [Candidatus Babeliales bacterium]
MRLILGIETSCDETAAAVYDSKNQKILSNVLHSQIKLHEKYGGVVPEIASRSHLARIKSIVEQALEEAALSFDAIDTIAVTTKPGLAGSLLVGLSYAKGLAWAGNKKLVGIDHLEGHLFSSMLQADGTKRDEHSFPYLALSMSGGHTSLYLVYSNQKYEIIGQTIDDAGGEAFDKVARMLGLPYPGGPHIEKKAEKINFQDFFKYPRVRLKNAKLNFSFSGLKTAVLYDLMKRGWYDLKKNRPTSNLTEENVQQVASSLLVCIADIVINHIKDALVLYPEIKGVTFIGGVACNKYIKGRIEQYTKARKLFTISPIPSFCVDNAAMIAYAASLSQTQSKESDWYLDIF